MKRLLFILFTCFLAFSCHNSQSEQELSMGKYHIPDEAITLDEDIEIEPPRTAEPTISPANVQEKGSKIIKTGTMNFEVNKLDKAKIRTDSLIKSVNGYYENELYNSYGNRNTYSLKIRIPNIQFDTLIQQLETGMGELKSKNINAKNVTEEYIDLNIRLENNLAYLQQYQLILRKAKTIKEILNVQEKIRRIEEEIESKKGRLKYLDSNVKYSTLHLEITELITKQLSNQPNFGRRILNAFNSGIKAFLSFIVGLVNIWPFILLVIFLFFLRKPIMNKFKRGNHQ